MEFDKGNKAIIDTLTPIEAEVFIKFLQTEILRHFRDIRDARALIKTVRNKFMKEDKMAGYGTTEYQEDEMTKQSEELVELISSLSIARVRLDRFNLEVAELRVEKGMSSGFARLYQLMGNFDRGIQQLITDAEIISSTYSKLNGE